jgi:hypothetical protein
VADVGVLAVVLMLSGAVLALAGAGVLAGRVAPEVAAAAAVLGGIALAVLPWLPMAPPTVAPEPEPVAAAPGVVVVSADGRRTVAAAPPPAPPPPLPGREAARIVIEAREAEPNDTLAGANVAALGVAIDGELAPGDRDWFAVDVPAGTSGALVANLVAEDASVSLALFDDAGQTLGIAATIGAIRVRSASLERRLDGPRFYVRVTPNADGPASYQLTVAARPR